MKLPQQLKVLTLKQRCKKISKYVFKCDNGKSYVVDSEENTPCLVCKYATDVFWDYINGPYSVICEKQVDYEPCDKFELDEDAITESDWLDSIVRYKQNENV